jgi:hypothetical protein
MAALENTNAFPRFGKIRRSDQPVVPAADDNAVKSRARAFFHPKPLRLA